MMNERLATKVARWMNFDDDEIVASQTCFWLQRKLFGGKRTNYHQS